MRKWNAICTAAILVLFLLHGIFGAFQLFGVGDTALKTLARAAVALVALHTLMGIKLTVDTLRAQKRAGVAYWKLNRLFWARRVSGLAVMVLLVFHMTAFGTTVEGAYRLRWFGSMKLAAQLLFALALGVHIIANVKPALIAFGVRSLKEWTAQILLVLSVILLFLAAAFVVYYLRWNVW